MHKYNKVTGRTETLEHREMFFLSDQHIRYKCMDSKKKSKTFRTQPVTSLIFGTNSVIFYTGKCDSHTFVLPYDTSVNNIGKSSGRYG